MESKTAKMLLMKDFYASLLLV